MDSYMESIEEGKPTGQICCFDIRCNKEYYNDITILFKLLDGIAKKWTIQIEEGEKTNYLHYQGRISLFKKTTKGNLIKLIEKENLKPFNYIKPTLKINTTGDNFYSYVNKLQTVIEGPFTRDNYKELYKIPYIPDYIQREFRGEIVWKPFQQEILNIREIYNSRYIDIFLDTRGNIGKSYFSRYLKIFKLAYLLDVEEGERMKQSLCDMLITNNDREPKLIILDLPRATDYKKINNVYRIIEIIKNGIISDSRNKYQEWIFEPPRIVVFCNDIPNKNLLSYDRWKIHKFNDDLSTYIDDNAWSVEIEKPKKVNINKLTDNQKLLIVDKFLEAEAEAEAEAQAEASEAEAL